MRPSKGHNEIGDDTSAYLGQWPGGSEKYGPCEICGKLCDITCYCTVRQLQTGGDVFGWRHAATFIGHRECILTEVAKMVEAKNKHQ